MTSVAASATVCEQVISAIEGLSNLDPIPAAGRIVQDSLPIRQAGEAVLLLPTVR